MYFSRFSYEGFSRLSLLISPVSYGTYGATRLSTNVIIGFLPKLTMLGADNAHFRMNATIDGSRVVIFIAVDLFGTSYYFSYSAFLGHVD